VKDGILLNVIVVEGLLILKLLACETQALLGRWYPFLGLDLALHIVDGVRSLNVKGDGLVGERLDEDLKGRLLYKNKPKTLNN
jgi:hypothetical protein